MNRHTQLLGIVIASIACATTRPSPADSAAAQAKVWKGIEAGGCLDATQCEQVARLSTADDAALPRRAKVVGCCSRLLLREPWNAKATPSPLDPLRQHCVDNLLWFAKNQPGVHDLMLWSSSVFMRNEATRVAMVQAWEEAAKREPENPDVFANLGYLYAMSYDPKASADAYAHAVELRPDDFWLGWALARGRWSQFERESGPEAVPASRYDEIWGLYSNALRLAPSSDDTSSIVKSEMAEIALELGHLEEARAIAGELIHCGKNTKDRFGCSKATHVGHIVLGKLALKQDDVSQASQHLLSAGNVAGDPGLNSFGPDVTLARDLLAWGVRDPVISYLDETSRFWGKGSDHPPPVESWKQQIKDGKTPNFLIW